MGWSGGSYTKGNAGTGGWTGDASLGIGIEAGRHDTQDDDFATGINQCINKDGSNAFTGDANLGGFKPTNIAAGTAAAPALCVGGDVNTGVFGPAADTWAVATNGTERVRVDSTGKVGIGTTSPAHQLHISGTDPRIEFTDTDTGADSYVSAASGTGALVLSADENNESANTSMTFRTDGTERMRIDSAGCVGIGTSSSTDTRLLVNGVGTTSATYSFTARTSGSVANFYIRDDGLIYTGLSANSPYNRTTATPVNMTVGGDGLLYRNTSSLRYKREVEDNPHGLSDVLKIRSITYKGNSDIDKEIIFGGMIAEEIHDLGLTEFVAYNDKGEPDSLYYGNMVAIAFKAIQELNAKVEALQARVEELEGA